MGTNVCHQPRQPDPFAPELSPARWRLPKGSSPKEALPIDRNPGCVCGGPFDPPE